MKKIYLMTVIFCLLISSSASAIDFQEDQILQASDYSSGNNFGASVSVSGDYAIIGTPFDNDNGSNSGAAYIFYRDGGTWIQQAKLIASDGGPSDFFGHSVSISGDYAIIGAYADDDNGTNSGSAYIYKRDGTSWSQQAKLIASDGQSIDLFGWSVSISGDYAVVGAKNEDDGGSDAGAAYIFVRSGTTWTQQTKLQAFDGASDDQFGISVSISGDYIIVGAWQNDEVPFNSGAAYIFVRIGTTWPLHSKLTASDANAQDFFGYSVSIDGDRVIVGAYGEDGVAGGTGAAYVFNRSGASWSEQAKLTASDAQNSDMFGWSVSISDDNVIIGVRGDDDNGSLSGSAYIFSKDQGGSDNWGQVQKLLASDGISSDYFGSSVSISGYYAISGASGKNVNFNNDAGAAYVFGDVDNIEEETECFSVKLDGLEDYLICTELLPGFDVFTIELWYKTETPGTPRGTLVEFSIDPVSTCIEEGDRLIWLDDDGRINFGINTSTHEILASASDGYNDGNWHHLACSYSNGSHEMKIYIDGSLSNSKTTSSGDIVFSWGHWKYGWGCPWDYYPEGPHFEGNIDEIRMWNAELPQSDINGWKDKYVDNTHPFYGVLVQYFKLDDGSGWIGLDEMGGADINLIYDAQWDFDGKFCGSTTATPPLTNLALWLDATDIDGDGDTGNNPAGGTPIDNWDDKTDPEEDATQADLSKMPLMHPTGINNHPSVQFTYDYSESGYGLSDILESPNESGIHDEITTGNPDKWDPDNQSKSYFLLFKPGNVVEGSGGPAPYYSDGRQCIFEVGGPLSGMNTYIAEDKICVGAWNRFEHKFMLLDPPGGGFYDNPNNIYYVRYTYDGLDRRIETSVGVYDPGNPGATRIYEAEPLSFEGLTRDFTNAVTRDDRSGVGGACRTRYHDYSIGAANSDHFGGHLGQALYYNDYIDPGMIDSFFDITYEIEFEGAPTFPKTSDWIVIERSLAKDEAVISTAWPNPFMDLTSFSLYLPDQQNIKVELFDSFAKNVTVLHDGILSQGIHDFTIDGNKLPSGMYLFRVTGDSFVETGKVILNK